MSESAANAATSRREPAGQRYELHEQLAVGGMGTIHRAYDRLAQREVAYKRLEVIDESSRARMTALFQREYDTLSHLPHPNIVEVYDYGKDAHGPYYVMELLSGSDLTALAPLPYREACRILRDIASALALLHARRLVHRDVSPNNIRLTSDGRAKLIDFGALTPFGRPRELVGTPAFIAPESLSGAELDQRCDLYSLGAVAYWSLTKRTALRVRSLDELIARLTDPIVPPSAYVSTIPEELDALVMAMLAGEPVGRPASAACLIDRLTAIADLEPEADERRVAFSYLAHPPLAGRAEALAELERALEASEHGRGQSIIVDSAEGHGRTALLESTILRAQLSGALVLRARGEGSAGPFGVARKLTQLAFTLCPELSETGEARRSFYARESVHQAQKPVSISELAERHAQLIASVQRALIEVSRRHFVLLVVDDLHLADAESIAVLASLSAEIGQSSFTLLTSTVTGSPRSTHRGVEKLRENAKSLKLAALDEAQVVELVESIFGNVPNTVRLARFLHAQSGGVPGQVLDLLRLLLRSNVLRYTLGTFTLPHDAHESRATINLSSAVLARVSELDDCAQDLARLLSLHDGALQPDLLSGASGRASPDVLRGLEGLKHLDLVTQTAEGFALAGSSLRAALRATMPDDQRKQLHVRLGRALLERSADSLEERVVASLHLLEGGAVDEAIEVVPRLYAGTLVARAVPLAEAALAVYERDRRSVERRVKVLATLVLAGFYGDSAAQNRHIDHSLALLAQVCGMRLAMRARPYVGAKVALVLGLIYAGVRRALKPKHERIDTLPYMIAEFIGQVANGVASAASALDGAAAKRYVQWLAPLAVMPKDSAAHLLREFCLAVTETASGDFAASSKRYGALIPALSKAVPGIHEELRETIYLGCLNGRAQAEVSSSSPAALELADELGRGDPFFAPHAECARMAYYANRGEHDKAEVHRARAELLALRGGTSWTAVTVLTVRRAQAAMFSRDAIMLVQAIADLDRLTTVAPKLATAKLLCEAFLESLRGRHAQSIALYEAVLDTEDARNLSSWRVDRTLFATVLVRAGEYARAKYVCLELLSGVPSEQAADAAWLMPRQQLALANGYLGDHDGAARELEALIDALQANDNPLQLGLAHGDRARVAILARDPAAFERHFAEMAKRLEETRNGTLIQQADGLLAAATQAGLRVRAQVAGRPTDKSADELDESTVLESYKSQDDEDEHMPTQRRAGRA